MTSTHLTNGNKRGKLREELNDLKTDIDDAITDLTDVLNDLDDEDLDREDRADLYGMAEAYAGDVRTALAALDVLMPKLENISGEV
jgi:hypothetical protein